MKRLVSWMLVWSMLFALIPANLGVSAEEAFFSEEGFHAESAGDEEVFSEEYFLPGEQFTAEEERIPYLEDGFPGDETKELEDRSVISVYDDRTREDDENLAAWQTWKPHVCVVQPEKNGRVIQGTVAIDWVIEAPQGETVPKGVQLYLYEVDLGSGAAYQVGKPITPGKKRGSAFDYWEYRTVEGIRGKVTLKKQRGGTHKYFARLEMNEKQKDKNKKETYGLNSTVNAVYVDDGSWKKLTKLTAENTADGSVKLKWAINEEGGWYYFGDPSGNEGVADNWTPTEETKGKKTIVKPSASWDGAYLVRAEYKLGNQKSSRYVQPSEIHYENGVYVLIDQNEALTNGATVIYSVTPWYQDRSGKTGRIKFTPAQTSALWMDAYITDAELTLDQKGALKLSAEFKTYDLADQILLNGFDGKAALVREENEYRIAEPAKSPVEMVSVVYYDAGGNQKESGGIPEGGYALFRVYGRAKKSKVSLMIQPVRLEGGKTIKGHKSAACTVKESSWRTAPVILGAAQVGEKQVKIRFQAGDDKIAEKYVITGFSKPVIVAVTKGEHTACRVISGEDIAFAEMDGGYTFAVTGEVKKAGKVKLTVQPVGTKTTIDKNGAEKTQELKGTKSRAVTAEIVPVDKSAAMDIRIDYDLGIETGIVSFTNLNENADHFEVYVAKRVYDSKLWGFDDTPIAHITIPAKGRGEYRTAPIAGLEFDEYTVFVETILKDTGARLVNTATCVTQVKTEHLP